MTIDQKQETIIDDFGLFEDWTGKYEYLISMGKSLTPLDESLKTDDNLIKGCQSRVWLHSALDSSGNLIFAADSDAIITKGIIALLVNVLSGQKPIDIAQTDLYFVDQIELKEHLSPTRSNGLAHMIQKMKMYGLAYTAKTEI